MLSCRLKFKHHFMARLIENGWAKSLHLGAGLLWWGCVRKSLGYKECQGIWGIVIVMFCYQRLYCNVLLSTSYSDISSYSTLTCTNICRTCRLQNARHSGKYFRWVSDPSRHQNLMISCLMSRSSPISQTRMGVNDKWSIYALWINGDLRRYTFRNYHSCDFCWFLHSLGVVGLAAYQLLEAHNFASLWSEKMKPTLLQKKSVTLLF